MIEAIQANYRHGARMWDHHRQALINRIKRIDPATNGHLGCVHNWGSEQARAIVALSDQRWQRYRRVLDKRYDQLIRLMR